jgi:hypothetical protein
MQVNASNREKSVFPTATCKAAEEDCLETLAVANCRSSRKIHSSAFRWNVKPDLHKRPHRFGLVTLRLANLDESEQVGIESTYPFLLLRAAL